MRTYKVTITETLQLEVCVTAPDRHEAEYLVEKQWKDSEYILDAGHFKDVTFSAAPQKDRAMER